MSIARGEQQPFEELTKRRNEKLLIVLTPKQQAKWKQLLGEPFKQKLRRFKELKQSSQGSNHPA